MQIDLIKRTAANPAAAKNILVIGVFHGDEEQGEYLINRYLNETGMSINDGVNSSYEPVDDCFVQKALSFNPKKQRKTGCQKNNVFYIPRLNPAKTRTNFNGVDLNRNFPTKNWGEDASSAGENPKDYFGGTAPGSEEETRFIVSLMNDISFDAVITLHAPYKIINYDGDKDGVALKLAEKISEITGYPVQKDIGYPTPGSFGTYAGVERDIPVITVEVDEDVSVETLYPGFYSLFKYLENEY